MREWISFPENVRAYFIVSSWDIENFLNTYPEAENFTDGVEIYEIRAVYYDALVRRWESEFIQQRRQPGRELFHRVDLIILPDGTYSLQVKEGFDILDLGSWHVAIENIPDDQWTVDPAQARES